jgi:hypothetical protein
MTPSGSLNSINKRRFLLARCVGSILINVRAVGVNRQRHHGSTAGEHKDEGQCGDEGLDG